MERLHACSSRALVTELKREVYDHNQSTFNISKTEQEHQGRAKSQPSAEDDCWEYNAWNSKSGPMYFFGHLQVEYKQKIFAMIGVFTWTAASAPKT